MSARQETLDDIIRQLESAPEHCRFGGPALAERLKKARKAETDGNSLRTIHAVEMAERDAAQTIAALRDALAPFPSLCMWLVENAGKKALGEEITKIVPLLRQRMAAAEKALKETQA